MNRPVCPMNRTVCPMINKQLNQQGEINPPLRYFCTAHRSEVVGRCPDIFSVSGQVEELAALAVNSR